MDFTEPAEHQDLRKAIGAVTDTYGPKYFAERAVAGEPTTELWRDLGKHGFIGINIPEQYGGGGAGMVELTIVCEETAAHGCPLLLLLEPSAAPASPARALLAPSGLPQGWWGCAGESGLGRVRGMGSRGMPVALAAAEAIKPDPAMLSGGGKLPFLKQMVGAKGRNIWGPAAALAATTGNALAMASIVAIDCNSAVDGITNTAASLRSVTRSASLTSPLKSTRSSMRRSRQIFSSRPRSSPAPAITIRNSVGANRVDA
jgi:hypothetical protein